MSGIGDGGMAARPPVCPRSAWAAATVVCVCDIHPRCRRLKRARRAAPRVSTARAPSLSTFPILLSHSRRHRAAAQRAAAMIESPQRAYSPPRAPAAPAPDDPSTDRDPLLAPTTKPSAPQPFDRPLARAVVGGGSSDGDDDDDACPTCLSRFTDANPATALECGHRFHLACHLEWEERCGSVGARLSCPVCSAPTRESVG